MKKYVNKIQGMVAIFCCMLIVPNVQGCSDDEKEQSFEAIEILQGKWYSSGIIGTPDANSDIFTLKKVKMADKDVWGDIISIKDKDFTCYVHSRCGNGCFPSSKGKITKGNTNQVSIFVERFDVDGDYYCDKKHLKLNKTLGVYNIEKVSETELKLVKVK